MTSKKIGHYNELISGHITQLEKELHCKCKVYIRKKERKETGVEL